MERAKSPEPPANGSFDAITVALGLAVIAFQDSDTRHAQLIDCVTLNNEAATR